MKPSTGSELLEAIERSLTEGHELSEASKPGKDADKSEWFKYAQSEGQRILDEAYKEMGTLYIWLGKAQWKQPQRKLEKLMTDTKMLRKRFD